MLSYLNGMTAGPAASVVRSGRRLRPWAVLAAALVMFAAGLWTGLWFLLPPAVALAMIAAVLIGSSIRNRRVTRRMARRQPHTRT